MDERRKHGWPFWFAVGVIAVSVLYVASFGPACWAVTHRRLPKAPTAFVYDPLLRHTWGAGIFWKPLHRYVAFCGGLAAFYNMGIERKCVR